MTAPAPGRTVSVVTANFNHGHQIENAIRSIALQTYPVVEHIIVDDASTDDSRDVIARLAEKYPGVRLLTCAHNIGPALASGRGVREARGDYIQFLSADDTLPPQSIATRLAVVTDDTDKALICGDIGYVDVQSGKVDHRRYFSAEKPVYFSTDALVAQQRNGLIIVNGGSALARREDLIAAKIDDGDLKWHCDAIGFNAIAYRRGLWYVPGIQQLFQKGGGGFSRGSFDWARQKTVLVHVFEVLNAPDFADVRGFFRQAGLLASFQHILRFLLLNPQHWAFLTWPLVRKAVAYSTFRTLRSLIPQTLVTRYVRNRSSRAGYG